MAAVPQGVDSPQTADSQQEGSSAVAGWGGKIGAGYERVKENLQTYRYVWASYIVVYGGFGLWLTYRWRKLRRTEDNVRNLQAQLIRLIEEENAADSAAVPEKPMTPTVVPEEPMNYTVIEEKPANSAAVPKRPTNTSAISKKPSNTTSLTDRRPHANKSTK